MEETFMTKQLILKQNDMNKLQNQQQDKAKIILMDVC